MNTGLSFTEVRSLAVTTNGFVFAGTSTGGVFRSIQSTTSVGAVGGELPQSFALFQNYPNPFNPATSIQYSVPPAEGGQYVSLKVYDVLGREVARLLNDVKAPGTYTVTWDASGEASGVYFYRVTATSFVETKKMLLLR
jgi:hypothetical protein